ncbi:MAG TPA: tetratricopeptide repeat protein [Pseudobdellovibrionaceae bacterium]|nr:tetratricopeptide repeat protein [Pseudobdellovibrionaceae bacterium]
MMTKKYLILAGLFALTACSSAPKEETPAAAPAPWEKENIQIPATSAPEKQSASKPAASSERDPVADLTAAVRGQNEERMKLAADEVLKQSPDHPLALNTLALYHYRKGRFELAGYLLGKAIQKDSQQASLHSNLGLVQLARGEKTAAIRSFRKALDLNGQDGTAAANLGTLYVMNKDYSKAVYALETAYRQGVRDAKTLNNYGIALAATGKGTQARDMYEAALKDSSNNREVLLNYAVLLVDHLGKNEEGLETINRLKFLGVPSESRERVSLLENKAKAGLK